jgi:hypothetical protein
MMKRLSITALVLVLLLPIVACGYNSQCIKNTSYNLGEETIALMGNAMVQQTIGCMVYRYDPVGIHRVIWQKSSYIETVESAVLKELLYAGREGDILHITYREYSVKGYPLTPFFQHIYYDLKTSDKIVFQENMIQVLEANNQQIRFKVIQGWVPILPER